MKVSTMRHIDRWAGVPACFLLTGLRRCGDLWRRLRRRRPPEIRRILFVKPAEQGATVLAYPALKRAAEMVGRENVYFLVFEENRFILDVMDVIPEQNVIAIPAGSIRSVLVGTLRALWRLRKLRIDAAIDFEFFARSSAVLTYLSGARVRVGYHSFAGEGPCRGDLMTHRLIYNPHLHTGQAFEVMVEALDASPKDLPAMALSHSSFDGCHGLTRSGWPYPLRSNTPTPENGRGHGTHQLTIDAIPETDASPVFTPLPEEIDQFRSVIEAQAGTGDFTPLVLLNANASDLLPLRRWPSERYVELAQRLIEKSPDVRIAFTGAPNEAGAVEKLTEAVGSDRCFSLAGKTTLRQLLVLYCLADVLVTNDSGPALFATLTTIQAVTLFGPETPALFGSNSERSHIVWKNLPCSPCVSAYNNRLSPCRNNLCMQLITVDEVFELVCGLCKL